MTPDLKNHRNLDNLRQAVKSPKSQYSMGYSCLKTTFLQLNHYIQKIYLTLLSTTCVKIHQIPYVTFETISHFSRQRCILFTKNIPSKCKFSDFSLFKLKFTKLLISFFKQEVSLSLICKSLFSVMRDNSSVLF